MIALLDVNFLIALTDQNHVHYSLAVSYFKKAMRDGWATCPIVENGFLRITGSPNYPSGTHSPEKAKQVLSAYCHMPGHQFWPDSISLLDASIFKELPSSKQLTDIYLLALAVKKKSSFVTFDKNIDVDLVYGGRSAYVLLDA